MRSGHRPSGAVDDEPADQSSRHTSDKRTPNVAERFRPSRNLYTEKTILSAALTSLARQANDRRKPSAHPCLRSAAGGLGCSDLDPEVRRGTCRDRDTQHRPAYDSRRRAGKSGRRVRLRREHATQDPTQRPVRAGVRSMRHARPLAPRPGSLEGLSAADLAGSRPSAGSRCRNGQYRHTPVDRDRDRVRRKRRRGECWSQASCVDRSQRRDCARGSCPPGRRLPAATERPRDRPHPSGPREPASHRDPAPTTTPHRSPHEAGTRPSDRDSDLPGHGPAQAQNPRHHTPVRCQSRRTSDCRAGRSRRAIARALPSRSRSRARRTAANGRTLAAIRTLRASALRRAAARHASAGHVTSCTALRVTSLLSEVSSVPGQDPTRDTRSTSVQAGARRPPNAAASGVSGALIDR